MNDRYQGDGPQGKTRKSAAKLKPKSEAASSVHIDKKPTTKQERKAARKRRDAQIAAKEKERQRKAEERERQARIAAGEDAEEPKKEGALDKVKKIFSSPPSDTKAASASKASTSTPARGMEPDTPEYRRYKKIYWILMGIGIVAVILSFVVNFTVPALLGGWGMMVPMGIAYAAIIGALVINYAKINKMKKAHMQATVGGKSSPKQQKHEQRKAEAARLLEENKKAQKEQKRANSKLPFMRKPKEEAEADTSDKAEGQG